MVKAAMRTSLSRADINQEAELQATNLGEKTAEAVSEVKVSNEYALKLASAIEQIADDFGKQANAGVGQGPNTLAISESRGGSAISDKSGQGKHQPPTVAPMKGETTIPNDMDHPAGGKEHMVLNNSGKTAGAKGLGALIKVEFSKVAGESAEKKETEGMDEAKKGLDKAEKAHAEEKKASPKTDALADYLLAQTKQAEDAINPAKISAGKGDTALPTSASGEGGGTPAGGAPQGPTGLVSSNESAKSFTRGQAYAGRKPELKKYFDEPALTNSTDKVLNNAFDHAGQASSKFSSALSVKTAAAKVLLTKLAEQADSAKESA
jgi:hypothetical protein